MQNQSKHNITFDTQLKTALRKRLHQILFCKSKHVDYDDSSDIANLRYSGPSLVSSGKKIVCAPFSRKHNKLYIIGKLNKCRFREKNELPVSLFLKKKIANNRANDHMSFN